MIFLMTCGLSIINISYWSLERNFENFAEEW